jgi:hypothetical protein
MLKDRVALAHDNVRFFFDRVEKELPELWQACYPRVYNEPKCGRYYSPKEPARHLAAVAIKVMENLDGRAEKYEFIVASHLARYRIPMFWLGHDMTVAITKTVPPGKIDWYEMDMPFPACVFMLPKGTLTHPTEGDVPFIAYARMKENETHVSQLVKGKGYGLINGGLIFLAATAGPGHLYHWNLPLDFYGPSVSIPDIDNTPVKDSAREHASHSFWRQLHMSEDDNRFMLEVVHATLGAILLMTDRPDLVTTGKMLKRVATKGRPPREFWSPNVLGENYRIKREATAPGDGTHASPRFHWVRGFYRETAYGPSRELRKRQWIEPYTRGI